MLRARHCPLVSMHRLRGPCRPSRVAPGDRPTRRTSTRAKLANTRNDAGVDMAAALRNATAFEVLDGDRSRQGRASSEKSAISPLRSSAQTSAYSSTPDTVCRYRAPTTWSRSMRSCGNASALDFRDGAGLISCSGRWKREAPTNILFLDACRDNPLAPKPRRATHGHTLGGYRARAWPPAEGPGSAPSSASPPQPGNVGARWDREKLPFCGRADQTPARHRTTI